MFGKVKTWLGIEGVKIEIIVPEIIKKSAKVVNGKIRLSSMHEQSVQQINIALIERYERGRKQDKLIDEYTLGTIQLQKTIKVPADKSIELDFQLPFKMLQSEMDDLQDSNFMLGGIVQAAKWLRGVKSNFRIEANAKVKGTALNPFCKEVINIR